MDDETDETNNEPATRDELIGELGRMGGLLDTLAALVLAGDIRAARSMAEAMRGGEIEGATRLDLGDERPKLTGWAVQHLATMLATHLDEMGARNHCAWKVHFPALDGKPARDLDLVAQWVEGVTTVERIARAERERDAAAARAAGLTSTLTALRASLCPLPEDCPLDLEAISARASAPGLTEGPWVAYFDEDAGRPCVECPARADGAKFLVAEVCSESSADAELIEHAREDVLALVGRVRELGADLARLNRDLVVQTSRGDGAERAEVQLTRERDALHAAVRAVAAAQLAHDRDPSDDTRAALDVALTALFALVPAEVSR